MRIGGAEVHKFPLFGDQHKKIACTHERTKALYLQGYIVTQDTGGRGGAKVQT